jgi:signal transduction histidine kinase
MQPYATERQVTLTLSPENVQPSTFNVQRSAFDLQPSIDGRAIQQALVNLIDNAIKHAPAATTVTVGLECARANAEPETRNAERGTQNPDRRPPPSVLLWVEDLGPGIPSEEHEKIFEPFYRRGSELRRETQGVGIGLTIVKHVAEAHGGRVTVRSAVGQGSRFTIELPVNPNAMGESPTKAD